MDLTNAVIARYNAEIATLTQAKILAEAQLEIANAELQRLRETLAAEQVKGNPLESEEDA